MQSIITFLLDGKTVSLDMNGTTGITPTTTVLQYLRNLPDHKGTKEGCAEGDCGACTVVLGEATPEGTMQYKSVDSCLVFVPMLHGKQLITVESLKNDTRELHPVQQAMVDEHGSQCGYCTPGFVMSLFSLYKNHTNPLRDQIEDSLTGNLCRCTGYKPIIQAAATSCVHDGIDQFTNNEPQTIKQLQGIPKGSIHIQTREQSYIKPASLGEAVVLKHQYPEALVISGATDVALRVTKRHEVLKQIIDLSDVPELKEWSETDTAITLGAGLSLNEVAEKIERDFPALYTMLSVFGSQQIRNLATLGGNLGTASPIGDTLPVLMAYDAQVTLEGINGHRIVSLNSYVIGYRKTVRKPDELITAITIPKLSNGTIVKSYKVSKRRDLDISTVSAGFRLELIGDNVVQAITLAYGGMAERTKRSNTAEQFLLSKKWNRKTIEEAMPLIDKDFTPITDARAGAEFRTIAARNLLLKFYSETVDEIWDMRYEKKNNLIVWR